MPQTSCCISDPAPRTCRETTADNGRQDHFRAQEADHTNQHPPHMKGDNLGDKTTSEPKKPTTPTNTQPPHEGRQPETTGDKTTSEAKKPTTPTNTHPPHEGKQRRQWETTGGHFRAQEADHANQHPPQMKRDNRRQRETRPLQSPRWRPHQPTPTPHMKGDTRRQWETTGDKTTSEPKKPNTPTNTHPRHEGRQPEKMEDNGRQDHFRAQEADHTNQHPPLT